MTIAKELEVHAREELSHALKVAAHIDYLGGTPSVTPKLVKASDEAEAMLRFDLENEKETIRNYRRRVRHACFGKSGTAISVIRGQGFQ